MRGVAHGMHVDYGLRGTSVVLQLTFVVRRHWWPGFRHVVIAMEIPPENAEVIASQLQLLAAEARSRN